MSGRRLASAVGAIACLALVFLATIVAGDSPEPASGQFAGRTLTVFAGAANKPPAEELAAMFEERTGASVVLNFGGSGKMLAAMELTGEGDVYFPGSSDWMDRAVDDGVVSRDSDADVAFLVSAINVAAGNPKNIKSLDDLMRPDVRVAIANPEFVCVGNYAVELLERNLSASEIEAFRRDNLVNYTDSCESLANAVAVGAVDAVIGWSVFSEWDDSRIETVRLAPDELVRMASIPIAPTANASDPKLAAAFVDLVTSAQGRRVFAKHGYFVDADVARRWAGAPPELPVGGSYTVPREWLGR